MLKMRDGFPAASGGLPFIGHLPKVLDDPLKMLRQAEASCGPMFWIHLGFGLRILFYVGTEPLGVLRNPHVVTGYDIFGDGKDSAAHSVLARDGTAHRAMRSTLNPSFSPGGMAKGAGDTMARVADAEATRRVGRRRIDPMDLGKTVAIDDIFSVIGVGVDAAPSWNRAYRISMSAVIPIPLYAKFVANASLRWIDDRVRELVVAARARGGGTSLLDMLVADSDRSRMPEHEIVGNIRVLGIAGYETTAAVVAWSLMRIADDPSLWKRLSAECGHAETPTTLPEASKFKVAESIFRESARFYPPLWLIVRRASEDITVDGRSVPAGTPIAVSPLWANRDPKVFANPDQFDPGRWVNRQISAQDLLSFGGGPHFCMGYHMATLEGVQILVAFTRECVKAGVAPRLAGPIPQSRYVVTGRPRSSTRIDLVPAGSE